MLETLIDESKALERAIAGEELSYNDGIELMNYDNLHALGAAADMCRQKLVGDQITFTSSSVDFRMISAFLEEKIPFATTPGILLINCSVS